MCHGSYPQRIIQVEVVDGERESEQIQAARNKLNKNIGRLRGDKQLDNAGRAARAQETSRLIEAGNYEGAAAVLAGETAVAPDASITPGTTTATRRTTARRVAMRLRSQSVL